MGLVTVQAYVPIAETIGSTPFATVLTQKTNGQASVSYAFDHWENMPSDPLAWDKNHKPLSKAAEVMLGIRQQKHLKLSPPSLRITWTNCEGMVLNLSCLQLFHILRRK